LIGRLDVLHVRRRETKVVARRTQRCAKIDITRAVLRSARIGDVPGDDFESLRQDGSSGRKYTEYTIK
jgi:hypothetical protein